MPFLRGSAFLAVSAAEGATLSTAPRSAAADSKHNCQAGWLMERTSCSLGQPVLHMHHPVK